MLEVVLSLSKEYVAYAETWVVDLLTGVKLIKLIKVIMSVNFCGVWSYSPRHEKYSESCQKGFYKDKV